MKYYGPSLSLVESLFEELRSLSTSQVTQPESGEYRTKNTKSKRKYDLLEKIFQGLVDLVYFLEFVEDHPELHQSYENYLKDLFGVTIDDSSPQPHHFKNRSSSLFDRFLGASLFYNFSSPAGITFRVILLHRMIKLYTLTMINRLGGDATEMELFRNNTQNAVLWSELLARRYKDEPQIAHRRLGYCLPLSYRERREMEKSSQNPL